ncbi:MAG: hypothetical protein AABZ30_15500 [Myxococcota bacterium]
MKWFHLLLAVGCTGSNGVFKSEDGEGEGEGEAEAEGEFGEGESEGVGVAAVEVPLDPNPLNSSGLTINEDGEMVLDSLGSSLVQPFLWIANSPDGTVTKIDTETGVEVGRYRSGPGGDDPSRTTVGLDGDVVVANRGGSSAVRIHADTASCPDVNSDGLISTSTGPADVLAWGADECVLWFHSFGPEGGGLARAAAFDFVADADGSLSSGVWIGLWDAQRLVKLDADTGATLATVDIPGHNPYGMAFDGAGDIWVSDRGANTIVRVDVATLTWEAIAIPSGCDPYGIAADGDGFVWVPGYSCGILHRYNSATGEWASVSLGGGNGRGVAHDGEGFVWVAVNNGPSGVHKIDAATMTTVATIPIATTLVGMAVDFNGYIWAVDQGYSQVYRIDPDTLALSTVPTGSNPYTYSDMTGFQLVNAAPPVGTYRTIVEGCGPETQWYELHWSAETPESTFVRFRARAANDEAELAAEAFVAVAQQPDDLSPADLMAALETAAIGASYGALLELEIALGSETAGVTPSLASVGVTSSCAGATIN